MVTFDDLVAFGPYLISISAATAAIFNIYYTIVKDRPQITITFRNAKVQSPPESGKRVDAICIHITNIGGRSTTILFPDIILPDGDILYLKPQWYPDPRKKGLEPSLTADAQSIWPICFKCRDRWGERPPFPYELAPGKLNEVWIKNSDLAAKLKELGYDSGEVSLKVSVPDASQKQHKSHKIIFDVDKAKLSIRSNRVFNRWIIDSYINCLSYNIRLEKGSLKDAKKGNKRKKFR